MALSRIVGTCILTETAVVLRGSVREVPDTCATVIPYAAYSYSKSLVDMSAPEQAEVEAVRTMLEAYVVAEESCEDRRTVREYHMSAPSAGPVSQVRAYVDGPSIGPRVLQLWGWGKGRADFSSGERDQLDDLVALVVGYMESEEPV